MTSRPQPKHTRKPPHERRAEIVGAAAHIALEEGLELITLRRVAQDLEVRPGLIGHYFPAADELLAEAFTHATTRERESLLPPHEAEKEPVDRLARFLVGLADGDYVGLSRLWLNARHLSRFKTPLRLAVRAQESRTRAALVALIDEGVRAGQFTTDDSVRTALHILVAVDGLGAYANDNDACADAHAGAGPGAGADDRAAPGDPGPDLGPDLGLGLDMRDVAIETAETRLGLSPGTLRAQVGATGGTTDGTTVRARS